MDAFQFTPQLKDAKSSALCTNVKRYAAKSMRSSDLFPLRTGVLSQRFRAAYVQWLCSIHFCPMTAILFTQTNPILLLQCGPTVWGKISLRFKEETTFTWRCDINQNLCNFVCLNHLVGAKNFGFVDGSQGVENSDCMVQRSSWQGTSYQSISHGKIRIGAGSDHLSGTVQRRTVCICVFATCKQILSR